MQIRIIQDEQLWTNFLLALNYNTFLQSPAWIDFNRRYGHKIWMLGLFESDQLVSTAFVLKLEAKRGRFLFCPHGPQAKQLTLEYLKIWTEYWRQLAAQEACGFVRISPIVDDTEANRAIFQAAGYRLAPMHMHAELTSVLDITGTVDVVRKRIKKNARYDLRKAEELLQQGTLTVETAATITLEMYEVYRQTFTRGAFVPFSREYLQSELEAFASRQSCELLLIRYKQQLISWGLIVFFGQRAFYHQGANVLVKGMPAPTLLQWLAIQTARSRSCLTYDFWGVAPLDNPRHPWWGISRFKRSFGGQDVAHLPAQDLIVNPWQYWPTWLVETIRRKRRGF